MRVSMRWTLLLLLPLALLIVDEVSAQRGHMTLLTVAEGANPLELPVGGTADLYLDIRPGTGKIYMDTFPLTKLDTQGSTRYANRIACEHVGADCDAYDFFYTIRASSPLIGGPSAGAAIAILTAAMLEGHDVDDRVAITGTIDSGGIVGPVAGISAKARAARDAGMEKLLISAFSYPTEVNQTYLRELNITAIEENTSINLSRAYQPVNLSTLGIPILQVATIGEALSHFTDGTYENGPVRIVEDPSYQKIMQSVGAELCERRDEISQQVAARGGNLSDPLNLSAQIAEAEANGDWYSLGSYCFREAIEYRAALFEDLTEAQLEEHRRTLLKTVQTFEDTIGQRPITTMAHLETSMIVRERLADARDALENEPTSRELAFAHERLNSANVWSSFFEMRSEGITLDTEFIISACKTRLLEAEERINYIDLYLPGNYLATAKLELNQAYQAQASANPVMCVFHASKANAQANLLSVTLALPRDRFALLIKEKLNISASVIARQSSFPILGYSYYRYARSLADHDQYSALTFAEYALELSSLDVYFPTEQSVRIPWLPIGLAFIFIGGIAVGVVAGSLLTRKHRAKRRGTQRRQTRR